MRSIIKITHKWQATEQRTNALTLYAFTFPMDQPYRGEASLTTLQKILLDHATNLVRSKGVQVENIL
jgi:hypothetical protein